MGLPKQHEWQQALLARCYDFHGAACILRAIAHVLRCHVYDDMISDTRSQANDDGTSSELRKNFLDVLKQAKVTVEEGAIVDTSVFHNLAQSTLLDRTIEGKTLNCCEYFLKATLPWDLYDQLPYR